MKFILEWVVTYIKEYASEQGEMSICGPVTAEDTRCSSLCALHGRRLTQLMIDIGANGDGQNLLSLLAGVGIDDESEQAEQMREAAEARLRELFPHLEAERIAAFQAARAQQVKFV